MITVIITLYTYLYSVKQQRPSLYRHRTKRGGPMVETSAIVILRHEENHAYISTTRAV